MVRIEHNSSKNRSSFLLKMGLSIILFLQIQAPKAGLSEVKAEPLAINPQAKCSREIAVNKPSELEKAVACHFHK